MRRPLDERLLSHLVATGIFDPPGLALLAISGGPDSVALLDLMSRVREDVGLTLATAHIVHGISKEATDFVTNIEALSNAYGLPLYIEELQLGPRASETLARRERYRALRSIQTALGAPYLVTAHHGDDQIETVLYRFLRGTGISGLAGIPASGPDGLVRPLLRFRRLDLEGWLEYRFPDPDVGPTIFDDPANADPRHDRSWLRHELLPVLRERFGPSLDSRIADVGTHAVMENAAWTALLNNLSELAFRRDSWSFEVARAPLARYDKLLSERILRAAGREVGCRLARNQATRLLQFAITGSSGRRMELGAGWEAVIVFDRIVVHKTLELKAPRFRRVDFVDRGEGMLVWDAWEFIWQSENAGATKRDSNPTWITYGPVEFRAPEAGDKIMPLGGVGSRKVRRVLGEARVPAHDRDRFPVVARGPDVLWLPGICRSNRAVPEFGEPAMRLEARAG